MSASCIHPLVAVGVEMRTVLVAVAVADVNGTEMPFRRLTRLVQNDVAAAHSGVEYAPGCY